MKSPEEKRVEEIRRILDKLGAFRDDMLEKDRSFFDDCNEAFAVWGAGMRMSSRQYLWLKDIEERYGK